MRVNRGQFCTERAQDARVDSGKFGSAGTEDCFASSLSHFAIQKIRSDVKIVLFIVRQTSRRSGP